MWIKKHKCPLISLFFLFGFIRNFFLSTHKIRYHLEWLNSSFRTLKVSFISPFALFLYFILFRYFLLILIPYFQSFLFLFYSPSFIIHFVQYSSFLITSFFSSFQFAIKNKNKNKNNKIIFSLPKSVKLILELIK